MVRNVAENNFNLSFNSVRDLGKKLRKADYEKALQERETFRSWFKRTILLKDTLGFLLVPADGDEPNYRDQYFACVYRHTDPDLRTS
jgi:hypothetical protein